MLNLWVVRRRLHSDKIHNKIASYNDNEVIFMLK